MTKEVATTLVNICLDIEDKYDIKFIEIGTDINHVHYLIQTVPKISPTQLVTIIKSITARMIFKINPEVKLKLWGGEFWADGYYVATVSQHSTESVVKDYVSKQGHSKYDLLHKRELISGNVPDTD